MAHQTWIADACRRWLPTEEYSGWTGRGSSSFTPGGVVCHWTAGPCNSTGRPSLNVCVNGREGLSGPLANVYFDRAGVAVVIAAGRANHAGDGGWKGLSGNSSVLGIEAECCNAGDWTPAQRSNYPRLVAALLEGIRRDASWACGHNEWAPSRKVDIHDWPMPTMRDQTAQLLAGGTAPLPPEEPDMTPEQTDAAIRAYTDPMNAQLVGVNATLGNINGQLAGIANQLAAVAGRLETVAGSVDALGRTDVALADAGRRTSLAVWSAVLPDQPMGWDGPTAPAPEPLEHEQWNAGRWWPWSDPEPSRRARR